MATKRSSSGSLKQPGGGSSNRGPRQHTGGGARPHLPPRPTDQDNNNNTSSLHLASLHNAFDDGVMGFTPLVRDGDSRVGWLLNMIDTTTLLPGDEDDIPHEASAVDMFFLEPSGAQFKATVVFQPYFYVRSIDSAKTAELAIILKRKFEGAIASLALVDLEDLDVPGHLTSHKMQRYVKLLFHTVGDTFQVRRALLQANVKFLKTSHTQTTHTAAATHTHNQQQQHHKYVDPLDELVADVREYDVPYTTRVCIDLNINAGSWYRVSIPNGKMAAAATTTTTNVLVEKLDLVDKAEPRCLAFDLEVTKLPLKFPDPNRDEIYMISYMCDGRGTLIISRTHVGEDINDFEFTPKPEFPGPFTVINEPNEQALIRCFFDHVRHIRPHIFVTYNGDSFDWPYLEARAKIYGMSMENEVGISNHARQNVGASSNPITKPPAGGGDASSGSDSDNDDDGHRRTTRTGAGSDVLMSSGDYRGRCSVHIDCMYWVKRDSFLPAGSRGLKNVARAKLGYEPAEVDAEDMQRLAMERPNEMAAYSSSDAVATYYLFDKYVNLFIFSLCTVIPMGAEDVLRKGSGTLCEALLMAQARKENIVCPNKEKQAQDKWHKGKLLDSETYVGGHVECLESGVYKDDIPLRFELDHTAFTELIAKAERDLEFAVTVEAGKKVQDCINFHLVLDEIKTKLLALQDDPIRTELPRIYHLDVGAMYPNIILTNRLQPCAVVTETDCAACEYNTPEADCKRVLDWEWRGEVMPGTRGEFRQQVNQLEYEQPHGVPFLEHSFSDQHGMIRARFKEYCQFAYKRTRDTVLESRKATICQKENSFYVDTVRAFRDRRNRYKGDAKKWGRVAKSATTEDEKIMAANRAFVYESLQLAHKCILNSFYGYVMRRGARWHSMEMAAVVTHQGSSLIKQARILVERVGKPLELDTDGIWCALPCSFPENFQLEFTDGSKHAVSYPCVMLNADVHANFTNPQYQTLSGGMYVKSEECSILFEIDGPYKCMVLPASQEEDKLLKKRYAVFSMDGKLSELKGFELKRRGELKIIKCFQAQVFEKFLQGTTLEECYKSVAGIANSWLDVLYTHGAQLTDAEVIDLISENRSMSRPLADYGEQKSTAITTAKRLAEFLGASMVQDKGLNCQLLIASRPVGAPTTDRAIPTAIFADQMDPLVRVDRLRRWLKDSSIGVDVDVRDVVDWDYYIDRLGKCIQKIITIPAGLQGIANPVPRVKHPEWLARRLRDAGESFKQRRIDSYFVAAPAEATTEDVEESSLDKVEKMDDVVVAVTAAAIVPPFPSTNFDAWLAARKAWWVTRRASHRKRALMNLQSTTTTTTTSKPAMIDLAQLSKRQQIQRESDTWQIVEIRPDLAEPGLMRFFVATTRGRIQSFYVRAPRTFYFDSANPDEQLVDMPPAVHRMATKKFLPHGRTWVHRRAQTHIQTNTHNPGPASNLFKITLDERLFRRNAKALANFLTRPDVLGAYETQVPLTMRLSCTLTNMAKLGGNHGTRDEMGTFSKPFKSTSLTKVAAEEAPAYLSGGVEYSRVFFYHSGSRDRQIFVLVFCADQEHLDGLPPRRASACFVFFSGGIEPVSVKAALQDELTNWSTQHQQDIGEVDLGEIHVETPRGGGSEACWVRVQDVLQDHITSRVHRPLVMLVQCRGGKQQAMEKLSSVLDDIPVIDLAPDRQTFPALQWRRLSLKRAIAKYLSHTQWWTERVACARYANVPIANIGTDYSVSIADVLFARHLEHNNHVLWASPSGIPDLGGAEVDVSHLIVDDEFENPAVRAPGAYRAICVEINLKELALNAVLHSERISEMENDDFDEPAGDTDPRHWSAASGNTVASFKILRYMCAKWFESAQAGLGTNEGVTAAGLLEYFYRWLSSPRSLMHDPALHRHVHRLMRKVFYQLLHEVKALGGVVVSATFHKLVVCTNRCAPETAKAYVVHLIETLHNKEVFGMISMEVERFWSQFIYMDDSNFGGILLDLDDVSTTTTTIKIVDNWNLRDYLPPLLQKPFQRFVSKFLTVPVLVQHSKTVDSEDEGDGDDEMTKTTTTTTMISNEDNNNTDDVLLPAQVHALRELVRVSFTRRMLQLIPEIDRQGVAAHPFPQLPGSHLHLHKPALEFTKCLCAVLELDYRVENEVRLLKRQALKMLRIAEFAPETKFINPAATLVVADVICGYCGHCEDMDLCRDPRVLMSFSMDVGAGEDHHMEWPCQKCQHPHDKTLIEGTLVELVHRRSLAYQLQDLVCIKCRMVRADNTSQYCTCSGKYQGAKQSSQEFMDSLAPFRSVAKYHGFEMLEEVVDWVGR